MARIYSFVLIVFETMSRKYKFIGFTFQLW